MADILQVSCSSVTTNLERLELLRLIEQVSVPAQREEFFVFFEEGLFKLLEMRRENTSQLLQTVRETVERVQDEETCRQIAHLQMWLQRYASPPTRPRARRRACSCTTSCPCCP